MYNGLTDLFETLQGKTITKFEVSPDKSNIEFETACGKRYNMYHDQDCCESVHVDDICGDIADVMNTPIYGADVLVKQDDKASESGTWTFYRLTSAKGCVQIRWYGSSNGYYSESVTFAEAA